MEKTYDAQQPPADDARPFWPWALGIFALALGLRLLHLFLMRGSPLLEVLVGDARGYSRWAERLAAGDWLGSEVFYQAPLYPYFMGVIYSFVGSDAAAIRLVQAVLGAVSCVLLAQAGARFVDRRSGIAAGLLLAVYAPAIYYDGIIQKASVALFFLCLALFLLGLYAARPRLGIAAAIGFAVGLLTLTRENSIVFIPALGLAFLFGPKATVPRRLGALALFTVGLAAALLPVAYRNQHVGGGFHLTTSQLGTNLYIGNNPKADGGYQPLRAGRGDPRYERIDATELAEAGAGRELTPAEVSQYWVGEVIDYIRTQPVDWLELMGRKFLLTWNAAEMNDAEDMYTYADTSWVLRGLNFVFFFGTLAPVAFVGLVATARDWRRLWPLYLLLASYTASLLIFYVFGRYRYPMVPFLVIFAAAGLVHLRGLITERRRVPLAIAALGAVGFAVLCNLPLLSKDEMRATTYRSLGSEFAGRDEYARAIALHRKSLEYNPDSSAAHYNIGNAQTAAGRPLEAIESYRRAIELDPGYVGAYRNLANVYRGMGRLNEAIQVYVKAVETDPGAVEVYNDLGATFAMQGRYPEAVACFEQALRLRPDFDAARVNLERALEHQQLEPGNAATGFPTEEGSAETST